MRGFIDSLCISWSSSASTLAQFACRLERWRSLSREFCLRSTSL